MTDGRDARQPQDSADLQANPGYALGQLARALTTAQQHPDAETRERAAQKAKSWKDVFLGMLSGALRIGGRKPVEGVPTWATLKVLQGGFATGELLAGGPLQPHEHALLARIGFKGAAGSERAALNAWYVSDPGLAEMTELVRSGRYRINVPEEAALPVIAWLAEHGRQDEARAVLDAIGPFFTKLRFYPAPAERPLPDTELVRVQDVGELVAELDRVRDRPELETLRENVRVWLPMYDRTVALFLETLGDGEPPHMIDSEGGRRTVQGAWPCQRYPEGWKERAKALLSEWGRSRKIATQSDAPTNRRRSLCELHDLLERAVEMPRRLSGHDVGRVRLILAGFISCRGAPDTGSCRSLRERQRGQIAGPTRLQRAQLLAARLRAYPQDGGLPSAEGVAGAVTAAESKLLKVPAGRALPKPLVAKLERCVDAPFETLVEKRVLKSGEAVAKVVPMLAGAARAASLSDESLRRLDRALYVAFRRRRSLLLVDLSSQVRIDELPWAAALKPLRSDGPANHEASRQLLGRVAQAALGAFPQTIVPNKLLQEVRALAKGAGLEFPVVDEIAADIFTGQLTEKYLKAALVASRLLEGSLYERYYAIDWEKVRSLEVAGRPDKVKTAPGLVELCRERAKEAGTPTGWSVAANGAVLEQCQILTTHNLATLFAELKLGDRLRPKLAELAQQDLAWICWRLQQKPMKLRNLKNAAYAWRQMVFFLSMLPIEEQRAFLGAAHGVLAKQPQEIARKLKPALAGLELAVSGRRLERSAPETRRFLGWTVGKHWYFEA